MQLKKSFIWSLINSFCVSILGFLSYSFLAQKLSPDEFGFYTFSLNVLGTFIVFASFGTHLVSSKLKSYFDNDKKVQQYLFQVYLFSSLLTIILFSCVYNFLPNFNAYDNIIFLFSIIIILCASFQRLISDYFRSKDRIISYFLFNSFGSNSGIIFWLIFILSILFLSYQEILNIKNIIFAIAICSFIPILALLLINFRKTSFFLKRFVSQISYFNDDFLFLFKTSFLLLTIVFLRTIKETSSFWILGYTSDIADVGIFFSAYKLSFILLLPLIVIENVIPQTLSSLYVKGDINKLEKFIRKISTYRFLIGIVTFTFCFIFAERLLTIFFGTDFIVATNIFRITILSMIPIILLGPCVSVLILTPFQNKYILIDSIFIIPFILCGIYFSNISSYYGMAIVFGIMTFLTNVCYFFYLRRQLKINTLPYLSFKKIIQLFKNDFYK